MTTIPRGQPIDVPRLVAVCPICNSHLQPAQVNCWEENDAGIWAAAEVEIDCVTEPEIDGPDWEAWFARHWRNMPQHYWQPVKDAVLKYINENFRFEMEP